MRTTLKYYNPENDQQLALTVEIVGEPRVVDDLTSSTRKQIAEKFRLIEA